MTFKYNESNLVSLHIQKEHMSPYQQAVQEHDGQNDQYQQNHVQNELEEQCSVSQIEKGSFNRRLDFDLGET